MLKILEKINKLQGYYVFDNGIYYEFGGPCILVDACPYLEISLSDIVPNSTGLDQFKMQFVFIPVVNSVKVPKAGVSPEMLDMVPGILKEMKNSKILENIDVAVAAVDDLLKDPVPITEDMAIDTKSCPSFKLSGNLSYYRLDARYDATDTLNPWPDINKITWFGQDLYVCTTLRDNKCYLTISPSSSIHDQELLVRLMNYKYAFKRYGIKTTSN